MLQLLSDCIDSGLGVPAVSESLQWPLIVHSVVVGGHVEWRASEVDQLVQEVWGSAVEERLQVTRKLITLQINPVGRERGKSMWLVSAYSSLRTHTHKWTHEVER